MKYLKLSKKISYSFGLFCLAMFISLAVNCTTAQAASNVKTTSNASSNTNTEDKKPEVKLNVKKKSIVKDSTFALVLYNLKDSYKVNFKSSDSDIASVDKEGVITAAKVGDATITVTVKEGNKTVDTLTCEVTVGVPAINIRFNIKTSTKLTVGKSILLETLLNPNNTVEEPVFSSMDTSVATVSSNGRITAKSAGTTYIYGSLANGAYAKICVTVIDDTNASPTLSLNKLK